MSVSTFEVVISTNAVSVFVLFLCICCDNALELLLVFVVGDLTLCQTLISGAVGDGSLENALFSTVGETILSDLCFVSTISSSILFWLTILVLYGGGELNIVALMIYV